MLEVLETAINNVTLNIEADTDPKIVNMSISNNPKFEGAIIEPFNAKKKCFYKIEQ